MPQATEKWFSYRSLLLLFGVPLILFVVFYEAITSASVTPSSQNTVLKDSRVVHAGQTSIRGNQAQYKTNITQLQTSNIQLKADLDALTNKQNALIEEQKADLDALTNKQNALMKKYEKDKEEQKRTHDKELDLLKAENAACITNTANGGTGNNAYTTNCVSSDVASGGSCTLTCSATGYTGTSTRLCTAGSFAALVAPTCNADANEKTTAALHDSVVIQPNICGDKPQQLKVMMRSDERQLLTSYMTPTTRYFEWGSGGSTETYPRLTQGTVVSIENYKRWCDKVSTLPFVQCRQKQGTLHYKCIVPYPTKDGGYPVDAAHNGDFDEYINAIEEYPNFDVVLVDARWRVACALRALDYITDDTIVFLHDHIIGKRDYYTPIFKWYEEIKRVHTLVAMRRRKGVARPTEEEFMTFKLQPEW